MNRFNIKFFGHLRTLCMLTGLVLSMVTHSCEGEKQPFHTGDKLDPSEFGSGGSQSTGDGFALGDILEVSFLVEATEGLTGILDTDLPFTGAPVGFNDPTPDRQVPFEFNFSYPKNNYQLQNAHLVLDTSRDNSDTEGIIVDGAFSGRPPAGLIRADVPTVEYRTYVDGDSNGTGENAYFIQWSLSHYKQDERNTFDLKLSDLLDATDLTSFSALQDGYLPVITGDDSPVYQAYLVVNGLTISDGDLTCEDSEELSFQNVFVHNDDNSVGGSAFTGTVGSPLDSWNAGAVGANTATEFYFDAALPQTKIENIALSSSSLLLRTVSDASPAAIVINGIGVAEAGFNKASATAQVEEWISDASSINAWSSFVAASDGTARSLDLNAMLGGSRMKTLLSQGKLNIAVAGGIATIQGTAATSTRDFGTAVGGPELSVAGTYHISVCSIPENENSPLKQGGLEQRDYDDGTGPVISSVQVSEITDTSARILWLTDEGASSRVDYGIKNTDTSTGADEEMKVFHSVVLTGLQAYKFYHFQIISADNFGNESTSAVEIFTTKR